MLNRRQFLASIAAGVTGLVTWRYLASTEEGAIVDIVRKRLYYLKLDPTGVNAFARDLVKRKIISGGKLRLIDIKMFRMNYFLQGNPFHLIFSSPFSRFYCAK